jgi:hypothetical protein
MRLSTVRKAAATAGVAIAALGLSASPAHAAHGTPFAPLANLQSQGIAGYLLQPAPASSSASTSFTVPGLICPASGLLGIAPGAFVFSGTGTSATLSGAFVLLICQNGATFYQADVIINGGQAVLSVAVAKGDKITTSVAVTAVKTSVTFKDTTKAFKQTFIGSGATPAAALDGIDSVQDSTGKQLRVPNFGNIAFSSSTIDGKPLSTAGAKAVDMVTATHVLQIQTSTLGTTGNTFSDTYKHS